MQPVSRWLERLRTLPDAVREQMTLAPFKCVGYLRT
ncbi:hypothetical protein XAB3213_4900003 [Xanthomonas citri pv. bilvae]|nr:hypothetical protein XAB3213_4900003 [Xanthomonas citri pv. bilvae]